MGAEAQTIAVYDLGGGTFDISILRIERGLFRVKATSGDTHLGGDDFDRAIIGWMQEAFQQQHGVDLPVEDDKLRSQLRKTAETAKIALTQATEYQIHLPIILENHCLNLEATLTRSKLEELVQPFINRTLDICNTTLQEAKLKTADIDQVLLVGGDKPDRLLSK